jgi:glucokinase
MLTLVADIGGTRIKLGIVHDQRIVAEEQITANSSQGLEPQLPRIAAALNSLCQRAGTSASSCAAIAFAFPSIVDSSTSRVLTAYGKYEDAPRLDLARWSLDTFGLPFVIENDARAALLGEWSVGAGRGSNDLVMVTLGTGLGTAVLVEGRPLRGKHGQAGIQGGHFTVQQSGRPCSCGNVGCAEAEASSFALPALARETEGFIDSDLSHRALIDYASVLDLAKQGDRCALALKNKTIEIWTSMVVNLIHAYDPERVVIGGGLMVAAGEFLPTLAAKVLGRVCTPWGEVQIVPGMLGNSAALLGCDFLIRDTLDQLQ